MFLEKACRETKETPGGLQGEHKPRCVSVHACKCTHVCVCARERKRPGGSPGLVFLAGEASAPLLTSEKDAVLLELGVWGVKKRKKIFVITDVTKI